MARIAVVGDVMLDAYCFCDVAGFSPEDDLAPKLVVRSKSYRPGGAANVACCLNRWGSEVGLFGVTGNDFPCETLSSLLRKEELERVYLPVVTGRPTTCKTRFVTPKSRQIARVDEECSVGVPGGTAEGLASAVEGFRPDAVVVSDYGKGVVTRFLMQRLAKPGLMIVVDPKCEDFGMYGPVYAITPNLKEFAAYRRGKHRCEAVHLIVTRAEQGAMVLDGCTGKGEFTVPVRRREMGDPAGCGDAFLAALVHSLCHDKRMLTDACLAASAAGALAFDMLGVACPAWEQVETELKFPEYKEIRCGTD